MTCGIPVSRVKCRNQRTGERQVGSFELLIYDRQPSNSIALLLIKVDEPL
jgi:hypothetical protein